MQKFLYIIPLLFLVGCEDSPNMPKIVCVEYNQQMVDILKIHGHTNTNPDRNVPCVKTEMICPHPSKPHEVSEGGRLYFQCRIK